MNLDQIRKGLIISAVATMLSGIAFAYFMVTSRKSANDAVNLNNDIVKEDNTEVEANVFTEDTSQNFFQYKPIFERALLAMVDKKTVEFNETRITEPKIKYYYNTDYRNKRFYKYVDYNIEDFSSLEELDKKLDVVKEVYMDGVFYIVDTKGLTKVNESEEKKFENSTIHLNDLKENISKYLGLYEKENLSVSILTIEKSDPEDIQKTRYGFQSPTLGNAALIIDDKFDIWEISIDYNGTYSTFVIEAYNSDLNIVQLEEGIDLNLMDPTPTPEVSPTPLTEASASPTPPDVLGTSDTKEELIKPVSNYVYSLSETCGMTKGSCYLEYGEDNKLKRIFISSCDTDCDSRKTILSVNNEEAQYIVEGYKTTSGFTKVFKFDKQTETVSMSYNFDQNLFEIFDPTKAKTSVDAKLSSYTNGCFVPTTAGLYCVGNLNRMSEEDIERIENYIKESAFLYKTYIETFK